MTGNDNTVRFSTATERVVEAFTYRLALTEESTDNEGKHEREIQNKLGYPGDWHYSPAGV